MKKIYAVFVFIVLLMSATLKAQIAVTGSTGANGVYTSLTNAGGAFAALNATASQAGNTITIQISASVTTESGTNILNGKGWSSMTMFTSTAGITLSGSAAAGLLVFNDADNVTINGTLVGGASLTIENTNTGGSALSLTNSSEFNTFKNCTFKGSATSTTNGVISFGSSTAGNGNSNNRVDNCDITASGSNLPTNGVFSNGAVNFKNSSDTISNCRIYDYFLATGSSNGVLVFTNCDKWVIDGNRFYQTATRNTSSGSPIYSAINVTSSGDKFTITNNIIGGANSSGTGYTTHGTNATTPAYKAIILANTGPIVAALPSASVVKYNRIRGIDITSSKGLTTASSNVFVGIEIQNGTTTDAASVIGNIIGGISGTDSIKITIFSGTINVVPAVGIYNRSTRGNIIDSNTIGAISMIGGSAGRTTPFAAIKTDPTSNSSTNIRYNTIGNSDVASSISMDNTFSGTVASLTGISTGANGSAGIYVIEGNTIQNLRHAANLTGTGATSAIIGIGNITLSGDFCTVRFNRINNLSMTGSSGPYEIEGIRHIGQTGGGAATGIIAYNQIYSLEMSSTNNVNSQVSGVVTASGNQAHIYNNMISLGTNAAGRVYCLNTPGVGNIKIYNNSFRVSGTTSLAAESAAFFRSANNFHDVKNNIFYNDRTAASATATSWAAKFTSALSTTFTYTGNNNLLYSSNTNLCAIAAANYTNLTDFQTALAASAGNSEGTGSKTAVVTFVSTGDLHTFDTDVLNAGINLSAATPAITNDIDLQFRNGSCTDIGADEIVFESLANRSTWTGTVDSRWCEACNWDRGIAPTTTQTAYIAAGLPNNPLLNTAAACGTALADTLLIKSGASVTITTGGALDLYGGFYNSGTFTHTGGDVTLKGTVNQQLNSSPAALSFYNLILNGSGNKTLLNNLAVTNQLSFTNGLLQMGSNNVTAQTISGGSSSSYAVTNGTGNFIVTDLGAGPATIAMGPTTTSYNPLIIASPPAATAFTFRVETGVNPASAIPFNAIDRTWYILPSPLPAAAVNITFQYADADANGGCNPTSVMEVGGYQSPVWNVVSSPTTSTPTGSASARQVSFPLNTWVSAYAIGNVGSILALNNAILLSARLNNNDVLLQWNVNSSSNVKRFDIQQDVNGQYNTIGTVNPAAGLLQYRFNTLLTGGGTQLYRIKMTDLNGRITYSNIARISLSGLSFALTAILPSPAADNAYLNIYSPGADLLSVQLFNNKGQLVLQRRIGVGAGTHIEQLPVSALSAGVYQVVIVNSKGEQVKGRLVKG
jgi:hypothetical protein